MSEQTQKPVLANATVSEMLRLDRLQTLKDALDQTILESIDRIEILEERRRKLWIEIQSNHQLDPSKHYEIDPLTGNITEREYVHPLVAMANEAAAGIAAMIHSLTRPVAEAAEKDPAAEQPTDTAINPNA